ncbi:MAG: O-antigen ligase family protein, partial [Vicinamibacteria bacterium]
MVRSRESGRELTALLIAFVLMTAALFALEPSYRWRTSSEGDRSWYEAEITPSRSTLALEPGELATTTVRISNVGKLTWRSTGRKPFHLSYRWFELDGEDGVRPLAIEGERTRLDSPVAPGDTIDLVAALRAPREPGSYVIIWDMVHENTTWFSDKVGLGVPVTVAVGDAVSGAERASARGIREAIHERSWRPGRMELWRIALNLFRGNPLLGVGPDNFRWLYGPASGHTAWDTRVFSNSLYLELLATVGLFGCAAFGILVGRALLGLKQRAASGRSPFVAATLAASLCGFLVHGLFDYLLAFTPIYLAFFVLLGASSAALREETAA